MEFNFQNFLRKDVKGPVEHRFEPLTGTETRINPARASRPKQGESNDPFEEIAKKSQERCPFCPDKIMEKVPKFDENIIKDGRLRRNQTLIFPNLSPFGSSHAVGVMCDAHYLKMDQFDMPILKDTLLASIDYLKAIHKNDNKMKYPVFVWNFLPPSAGSIIHPHIQMLVEDSPVPSLNHQYERAKEYHSKYNRNYFEDLMEFEKSNKSRLVYQNSTVSVITAYAPRGVNQVEFIFPKISTITQLNEKQAEEFADALSKVLKGYHSIGIGSFNVASFSGAMDSEHDQKFFWLNIRLFSRPAPNGVYTNDTGPMERMFDSFVIDSVPETLAQNLRQALEK